MVTRKLEHFSRNKDQHFAFLLRINENLKFNINIKSLNKSLIPVASLTTDMSVGLPKPDLNNIAETIFLYKLSKSSLVLALESVISRITGCKRDSRTLLCSSRNSA